MFGSIVQQQVHKVKGVKEAEPAAEAGQCSVTDVPPPFITT